MPSIRLSDLIDIASENAIADDLDNRAQQSSGQTKNDLRDRAQAIRNHAMIMASGLTVDLTQTNGLAVQIAKLKADLDHSKEVLKRIQKAKDALSLATKIVGAISSLFSGNVTGIVSSFKELKDSADAFAVKYPVV